MRKLKLRLDDLSVDTFHPAAQGRASGTVQGHVETHWFQCEYVRTDPAGDCRTNECAGYYPTESCDTNHTCDGADSCNCLYDATHPMVCCTNEGCSKYGMMC